RDRHLARGALHAEQLQRLRQVVEEPRVRLDDGQQLAIAHEAGLLAQDVVADRRRDDAGLRGFLDEDALDGGRLVLPAEVREQLFTGAAKSDAYNTATVELVETDAMEHASQHRAAVLGRAPRSA